MEDETTAYTPRCAECGAIFQTTAPDALFCCTSHRKTYNNRRALRGAQIYDCFMAMRYHRPWANAKGLWQMMCRLASHWRQADLAAGRTSYLAPAQRWAEQNQASLRNNQTQLQIGRRARG